MNPTNHSLITVLQRAEGERDQLLAALQRAEELARRAQTQAEQLQTYRGEYRQRWTAQFSRQGQGAIEIVHCYQSFMQRLEEALQQQAEQVASAEGHCTRLREKLAAAELRVASVKKLIERRQAEHQRTAARRDQRQTDETAQQLHWRARHGEPVHH